VKISEPNHTEARHSGDKMRVPHRELSVANYIAHYSGKKQKGGGPIGPVFTGSRFHRGRGVGTFLTGIVRGISRLISATPDWVKSGAKLAGVSALRNLGEYGDNVKSGMDKKEARKRAVQSTAADVMEGVAKRFRGQGSKRKRKRSNVRKVKIVRRIGKGIKLKKGGCKIKTLTGSGKRKKMRRKNKKSIKRRTKFDLLSL
jgi:hypothetical protein